MDERTPRPQVGVCSFLFSLFKCPTAYAEGRLCKRSVELIHRLLAAVPDNALRRIDSLLKRLCQNLLICLGRHADDMIDHIMFLAGRGAHADLHTGELLCSQMGNDILDAIVSAGAAGRPYPQFPHR